MVERRRGCGGGVELEDFIKDFCIKGESQNWV